VIDVGHTPRRYPAIARKPEGNSWRRKLDSRAGVSIDKKADEIVAALASSFDTIICTAEPPQGGGPDSIADAVRKAHPEAHRSRRRNH